MSRWELPDNWQWAPAAAIAEIVGGGTPPTKDPENFTENGIPWLTPSDLSNFHGVYISRGRRDLSQKGYDSSGAQLIPRDSVLFTSRAPIGYCVIASNDICTNQGFKSFVLMGNIDPKFIRHYLIASKDYAESLGSGSTFTELSGARIAELEFPIPPLNEQKRIVARIEELQVRSQRAREALETVPDLVEQLRQSLLSGAFRGDLTKEWRKKNPDNEPASELLKRIRTERRRRWEDIELEKLKAKGLTGETLGEEFSKRRKQYKEPTPVDTTGFPELPQNWHWASLEEISEWVTDGTHQPPPFTKEGIPFLVISNMVNGKIEWGEIDKWVSPETYEKYTGNYKPKKGDIIYSTVGSYGVAVEIVTDRRFMFQRHIGHLRPLCELSPSKYLTYALNSPFTKSQADKVARGVAQKTVNLSDLRRFSIPLSPLGEQKEMVSLLDKAFQIIEIQRQSFRSSLSNIDTVDRSILSRAFRGELVPQNPNDEPASVLLERIREEKSRVKTQHKRNLRSEGGKVLDHKENKSAVVSRKEG